MYTGNNHGSIACLKKMMGKGEILAAVRKVYEVAATHNVALGLFGSPGSLQRFSMRTLCQDY